MIVAMNFWKSSHATQQNPNMAKKKKSHKKKRTLLGRLHRTPRQRPPNTNYVSLQERFQHQYTALQSLNVNKHYTPPATPQPFGNTPTPIPTEDKSFGWGTFFDYLANLLPDWSTPAPSPANVVPTPATPAAPTAPDTTPINPFVPEPTTSPNVEPTSTQPPNTAPDPLNFTLDSIRIVADEVITDALDDLDRVKTAWASKVIEMSSIATGAIAHLLSGDVFSDINSAIKAAIIPLGGHQTLQSVLQAYLQLGIYSDKINFLNGMAKQYVISESVLRHVNSNMLKPSVSIANFETELVGILESTQNGVRPDPEKIQDQEMGRQLRSGTFVADSKVMNPALKPTKSLGSRNGPANFRGPGSRYSQTDSRGPGWWRQEPTKPKIDDPPVILQLPPPAPPKETTILTEWPRKPETDRQLVAQSPPESLENINMLISLYARTLEKDPEYRATLKADMVQKGLISPHTEPSIHRLAKHKVTPESRALVLT